MDKSIAAAAETIRGPKGELFVRLMAEAYQTLASPTGDRHFVAEFMALATNRGRTPASDEREQAVEAAISTAEELGLLKTGSGWPVMTPAGFLVGNVAKEYCYFVDNGRKLPSPRPPAELFAGKDVLDVGCSFGLWLWEFQRAARSTMGIEAQEEYAVLGRALSVREGLDNPNIVAGRAEGLKEMVKPQSFDFVFSRLVLNYVKIRPVVAMMVDALRPGGTLWIQVDPARLLPRGLFLRNMSWRQKGFLMLEVLNLPICSLTGHQLSVPSRGRMHARHQPANPPIWWWRNELRRNGLTDIRLVDSGPSPVFCARK